MFDGQGSQIGIVDKVCLNTSQPEQPAENIAVLLGRVWHPNRAATEPSNDLVSGLAVGDGLARTRGFVTTRRNARILAHGNPTRVGPFSWRSNQSRAAGCCGKRLV